MAWVENNNKLPADYLRIIFRWHHDHWYGSQVAVLLRGKKKKQTMNNYFHNYMDFIFLKQNCQPKKWPKTDIHTLTVLRRS